MCNLSPAALAKRRAYTVRWKQVNKDRVREHQRKCRLKHPGRAMQFRRDFQRKTGESYEKVRNDATLPLATFHYEKWGEVEDAMLFNGLPDLKLVKELGRTLGAIRARRCNLRKLNASAPDSGHSED